MAPSDENDCTEDFCQKQHSVLLAHLEAVLAYNRTKNLTSIKDLEAGKVLHIQDSLAVASELTAAPQGMMADLGSGAGYPGLPLALVSGRQAVLIEANKKKARFLKDFIVAHGLSKQISVAALRSEELALEQKEAFAAVTARAVAELPTLLELAAPLLAQGGHFIALKGRPATSERERGAVAAEKLGMSPLDMRRYKLSDNATQRCVLVYEKTGESQIEVPRRPGMAAKHPLA
ncbi:MAG: 16S rRNA (guanine(527)-N(7))-methyltransferase RsmG [Coriobacteriales bacterium]|jgi:16S rRNA (guanine527-N7)-methyltransferase|nr:16S rRNA (guanine(527)-N(7))-methyltransferase RsmG [Coriobacteriales bacterium]